MYERIVGDEMMVTVEDINNGYCLMIQMSGTRDAMKRLMSGEKLIGLRHEYLADITPPDGLIYAGDTMGRWWYI